MHGKKSLNNWTKTVVVSIASGMGGIPVTVQMQRPRIFFGLML